jgi:hypothetical protein
MALIELFHVVADEYLINASVTDLIEGQFVKLNSSGEVVKATGAALERAIGVAGDTKSTSMSGLPGIAEGSGVSGRTFVNRVADSFDETKASGKITVYHSGGKFASNQFVTAPTLAWAVGLPLYIDGSPAADEGKLTTDVSASTQVVATCLKVPGAYASGVPGIDINGDLTLGSYMEFKLEI